MWEGRSMVSGNAWQNYVLLTAPLSVLAARAEMMGMKVPVNPDAEGGFTVGWMCVGWR